MENLSELVANAEWLPHRLDVSRGQIQFARLSRDDHHRLTFLTDEYIGSEAPKVTVPIQEVAAASSSLPPSRCHFLFHSAFCCSTLIARALDLKGVCMGLKEPLVLQDLSDAALALGDPRRLLPHLRLITALLARPFGAGEAVVVKPTNIVNPIAEHILATVPDAKALLLYSPLPKFLRSVAAKGLFGRIWARKSLAFHGRQAAFDPGYSETERWIHTDLQVAALGWLQQQAQFAQMLAKAPFGRVMTLDSETLLNDPAAALAAMDKLFGLGVGPRGMASVATGSVFAYDSKDHTKLFDRAERGARMIEEIDFHASEIEMVVNWARRVATHFNVPIHLRGELLECRH